MRNRGNSMIIAVISLCLLAGLGGCAASEFIRPIDMLIRPPYENARQEQLAAKLAQLQGEASTAGGRLIFRHPMGGRFRDAVTTQDLDGDGQAEAVVFYSGFEGALPENPEIRIAVFSLRGGEWGDPLTLQGDGGAVASLAFPALDAQGRRGILVCWQKESGGEFFSLYTLKDGNTLEKLLVQNYAALAVCDMNGDGADEVVFIQAGDAEKRTSPKAVALGYDAVKEQVFLLENDWLNLSPYAAFVGLTPLPLENGRCALLLDFCRLLASVEKPKMETLLLALEPEFGKTGADSLQIWLAEADTAREDITLRVKDFDGDGLPEIPAEYELPGSEMTYAGQSGAQPMTLLRWNRVVQSGVVWGLKPVAEDILCLTADRWVQLPPELAGRVTIRGTDDGVTRELRFFRRDRDGSAGPELFGVTVVLATGELRNAELTERGRDEGIQLDFLLNPAAEET